MWSARLTPLDYTQNNPLNITTMYVQKVAICMFSKAKGKAELYLLDHKKVGKKPLFKS